MVIKNTFLSNTDNASIALRKQLIEECNLFSVLDLPGGAFLGTGVKTVVIFFKKGEPTKKVWYYQLNLDRNMGKTNPLNENDLKDFVSLSKIKKNTTNSWSVDVGKINKDTCDLGIKNPNFIEKNDERVPAEIFSEIEELDKQYNEKIKTIKDIL